jgi:hypothetical protein
VFERLIRATEKVCSEIARSEWARPFAIDCDLAAEFGIPATFVVAILIARVLIFDCGAEMAQGPCSAKAL